MPFSHQTWKPKNTILSSLRKQMSTLPDSINTLCGDATPFLDWVAHMLQYPNVKPQKAIALVGPPGSGKTLLLRLVARLIGENNMLQTSSLIQSKMNFNGDFEGITLVSLEECNLGQEGHLIKSLISDTHINIRRRYETMRTIPSFHRVVITTHALPASLNSRCTIINCDTIQEPFFYASFYEAMNDPINIEALRQVLTERQINADLTH